MKPEILQNRFKQLGWTRYRLTQEYCRVKGEPADAATVRRYEGTIKRALEMPGRCSSEVIEAVIKAMDGEQIIRWNQRQEIVTGQEEVKIG